jgi:hypothetical protein
MNKMQIDFSTLDLEELAKLPVYTKPPSYYISDSMGSGCFLDPPGYPTYFIQHIYTQHGNEPYRGPTAVIKNRVIERSWEDGETWENRQSAHKALMDKLYIKPALNHPRTKEWINTLYKYFQHCYVDDSLGDNARHADKLIIYPVPSYQLEQYNISKYKKEYRIKELRNKRRDAIATKNDIIIEKAKSISTPENHAAHRHVIEFYPDAKPMTSLIETQQKAFTWYETLPRKPSPEECPGESRWGAGHRHPMNGNWCQVCGWEKGE